jgi:trk system potassium uptake protein TrkH
VGLLVIGAVLLLLLEWRGAFAGAPPLQKFGLALFQSATTRTAGFNSMDLTLLSPASLLVMIVLMFIGAGPGSTAGGVKLTTLAVLVANVRAIAAGRGEPRLFDREVGLLAVRRATMVVNTYLATAVVAVFALLVTEHADPLATVFETVSALGTVGLSLGLTPELSGPGRFIVVLLMLVGRAGPLALAYGVVREARDRNVRYPSTGLQIG